MDNGAFVATCEEYASLYETYLQDSVNTNSDLHLVVDETVDYYKTTIYKGETDFKISLIFGENGQLVKANGKVDTIKLMCEHDQLNNDYWVSTFAVLIQTNHPDLSYADALHQLGTFIQNGENSADFRIETGSGAVNYRFEMTDAPTALTLMATTNDYNEFDTIREPDAEVSAPSESDSVEYEYHWNTPVEISPTVTVGFYTDGTYYWFEMSNSERRGEFLKTMLREGTSDFGFDKKAIADWIDHVIDIADNIWDDNNMSYARAEGYGIEWTAYMTKGEELPGIIGLKVNSETELTAVCGRRSTGLEVLD